jgi:signal transduction histidine kinase
MPEETIVQQATTQQGGGQPRSGELQRTIDALRAEIIDCKRVEQLLRSADNRKDVFLATLAHELRNPLAPLTAASQLIAKEPERTEQVRQLAGMMLQQIDQLVRLIDDLADVSRIASGKLTLKSEPIEVDEFLKAAVDQSRPMIDAQQHTLSIAAAAEPLVIQGDKVRLAQCISNLLINAAKYTPAGGRIDLVARREGGEVMIAVRDNGIGIPPEMQARIFELFAQVDSSTTRTCGGLGIGLAIVKRLIELHGGTIRALSEGVGKGSQFIVRLPLAGAAALKPSEADADGGRPLPGLRILIVDDNESAAHLMSRLLQKLGQEVHVADSGPAALALMDQLHPDIVISDVAMPGMSGYDLARQIRGRELPHRPYLVAVTGYGQDSDRLEALAAGFDKHLTKPVGVSTLEELVRSRGGRR